jgi:hypothetical protein
MPKPSSSATIVKQLRADLAEARAVIGDLLGMLRERMVPGSSRHRTAGRAAATC